MLTIDDIKLAASCFVLAGIFLLFGAAFFSWCGWLAIQKEQKVITARKKRNHQSGMTLVEILICVCVLLILAAISVSSLLRSQQAARSASATGSLRAIASAETSFMINYGTYSPSLAVLGNSDDPTCTVSAASTCQLDGYLSAGQRAGYVFSFVLISAGQGYTVNADPANGQSGTHFYVDESAVIHFDQVPATQASPVLQ